MGTDPLAAAFPLLRSEDFLTTSEATKDYNCIAWAAGQTDAWWWPDDHKQAYWPEGAPREETLEAFFQTFGLLGYVPCQDDQLESGQEKVALYALNGKPTHAARQLPDGQWTSKLGKEVDITHTLRGLEGPRYGKVAAFLKRSRS
jgi:hypothetical protein